MGPIETRQRLDALEAAIAVIQKELTKLTNELAKLKAGKSKKTQD